MGLELLEEADVVFGEEAEVLDAVLDHRETLDAHAEGKPLAGFGIVADVAEHIRVDQPEFLQTLQPLPPHITQVKSHSTLGSVKGKKLGRIRTFTPSPKNSEANAMSVLLRSARETLVSM